jgi:hypothetical protein
LHPTDELRNALSRRDRGLPAEKLLRPFKCAHEYRLIAWPTTELPANYPAQDYGRLLSKNNSRRGACQIRSRGACKSTLSVPSYSAKDR